jgi:glycosyltransferase involved in cell wall biosynthesis
MAQTKHDKILIATPAFGYQTFVNYTNSLLQFVTKPQPEDLSYSTTVHLHSGSALISHARNDCVRHFLSSDATKLLFVDADIGFTPEDVWRLLRRDEDIAFAPYITKSLDGPSKSKFVLKFKDDNEIIMAPDGFVEVLSGPTGFMMIDRKAFLKLDEAYPDARTRMSYIKNGEVIEDLNYPSYFDCITHETQGALGEDISFCKKWEEMGETMWADAQAALTHYGTYAFQSQLALNLQRENKAGK